MGIAKPFYYLNETNKSQNVCLHTGLILAQTSFHPYKRVCKSIKPMYRQTFCL
jgi:hypothetical protein